jgi:hypothetical protein
MTVHKNIRFSIFGASHAPRPHHQLKAEIFETLQQIRTEALRALPIATCFASLPVNLKATTHGRAPFLVQVGWSSVRNK